MPHFSLPELKAAADLVHTIIPPTPQFAWPLLTKRLGCEVWVKHENHTPIGAFKVRGGLVYMAALQKHSPNVVAVTSATRGNHGQSIAFAAKRSGLRSRIYIPEGNSVEKNAAMAALGAELVVHGRDFDEAKDACAAAAASEALHFVPSFHPELVKGVATYALEFFDAAPTLDRVYAPIGMGSGICGLIRTRDLLGLKTEIIGVVSDGAPAVALSCKTNEIIRTATAKTFADGLACRDPHPLAIDLIRTGVARIIQVSDSEVAAAIRAYFADTHNLAEGAGAAALAAAQKEKQTLQGLQIGVILSGGNIDRDVFKQVLSGQTPSAGDQTRIRNRN
ncbi:MAG: threonine dehydratase [Hyphomicrobiaceae bacterium]